MAKTLTQARLKKLLRYNPKTGEFFWRMRARPRSTSLMGQRAGGIDAPKGYWRIKIAGKSFRGHRLAWLYVYGRWPKKELDHIKWNRSSCRIADLREATRSQNSVNSVVVKNRTGFKGVQWESSRRKWRADIKHDGKPITLGRFSTAEAAHKAYRSAAIKLHGGFYSGR